MDGSHCSAGPKGFLKGLINAKDFLYCTKRMSLRPSTLLQSIYIQGSVSHTGTGVTMTHRESSRVIVLPHQEMSHTESQ